MQNPRFAASFLGALTLAVASTFLVSQEVDAQTSVQPALRITCESSHNRDNHCPADTRNGVALVRSIGRERCVIGRNWGYDRSGVWVADGCTGEFAIGSSGNGYGWGWGNRFTGYVYCESVGARRNECAINTRNGVRLINQVSRQPCVEGRTWGFNSRGIWVTGNCRAEFEVRISGPDVPPPRPLPSPTPRPLPAEALVTCSSVANREQFCRLPIDADRVVLERQLSRAACVEGRSWGYRQTGIYVRNGCSGQFRVVDYRARNGGRADGRGGRYDGRGEDIERITCASDNFRRNYCDFPNNGVRLVREMGRAPCVEDRTWGHDRRGVWVDKGCVAEFDVRDRERRGQDRDRDGERDWDERDDRDYDGD